MDIPQTKHHRFGIITYDSHITEVNKGPCLPNNTTFRSILNIVLLIQTIYITYLYRN